MKITQSIVSPTIGFFKKNFIERWGFKEYHDINKPVVFFGIAGKQDLYENHKGYKIFLPSTPEDVIYLQNLKNHNKTFLISKRETSTPDNIICKDIVPEIKDYSIFKPNILGDKIYTYTGFKDGWNKNHPLINEIQKQISYEIITTSHQNIKDYHSFFDLKSKFYDKCFLNLNLTDGNGMTTVRELGLMGRKTITMRNNIIYDYPCIINCNNIKEIVDTINKESYKINTTQPPIDSHTVGDEWLDLDWWIKN